MVKERTLKLFTILTVLSCIMGLFTICAIFLSACSKDAPEKPQEIQIGHPVTDERAVDRGPVNLGGQAPARSGQAAAKEAEVKGGAFQGLDPAKVAKLSPAARKVLEERQAFREKTKANPNMTGDEFMKAANGGREVQPPKY